MTNKRKFYVVAHREQVVGSAQSVARIDKFAGEDNSAVEFRGFAKNSKGDERAPWISTRSKDEDQCEIQGRRASRISDEIQAVRLAHAPVLTASTKSTMRWPRQRSGVRPGALETARRWRRRSTEIVARSRTIEVSKPAARQSAP